MVLGKSQGAYRVKYKISRNPHEENWAVSLTLRIKNSVMMGQKA